jgi:phosphoribosylformylglycinamidine synthase
MAVGVNVDQVPVRTMDAEALAAVSAERKLALSIEDMQAIQAQYVAWERDPTEVELEVWAQTWSEHCKHRVLNARITYTDADGQTQVIDSLFDTYIRQPTEQLMRERPDFVLSAFHDNAGFIRFDDERAVGLKVETHNHPSAIEPYAGANTGLGGVIRDILGAGQGAEPIASLDVFCVGRPDTPAADVAAAGVIHPLGILRGVVRGVRDYGNRMGIPTVGGALVLDDGYLHNPLVYCGTAGLIPVAAIPKQTRPGQRILVLGGRTGRDGLRGATFSSASLDAQSREADQGAVQIGNPIEEKKAADCLLAARREGLVACVTDCGAGGLSSAVGEMGRDHGARIDLEKVPLKAADLTAWEIFLSESQERMVLAVEPQHVARLQELARRYASECTDIGEITGRGVLEVYAQGQPVCALPAEALHDAPQRQMVAVSRGHGGQSERAAARPTGCDDDAAALRGVLGSLDVCSREPIVREYDFEVQGHTVGKRLAGPGGDCPGDAAVLAVQGSGRGLALSVALHPGYAADPYRMGQASVDEALRQVVVSGADPDQVALLDNLCLGHPDDPAVLGDLVELVQGMAAAAQVAGLPFVSGKDSFYNGYETATGMVSIPPTLLISAMGIVPQVARRVPTQVRRGGERIGVLGVTRAEIGGTAYARWRGMSDGVVPAWDGEVAMAVYRRYHAAVQQGWITAAHDVSDGGLAVTLAEMGFGLRAGLAVDLAALPVAGEVGLGARLFAESLGRIVFTCAAEDAGAVAEHFAGLPFTWLGETVSGAARLRVRQGDDVVMDESLDELKAIWKQALTQYY